LRLQEEILTQQLREHLFADRVESTFAQQYLDHCKVALYEIVLDNGDFAMELFYALQAKEVTFAALAHDHAATPSLRRRGGYLGRKRRAELPPEIAAAAFAATPPQLLRPLQREGRSHLIFVEQRDEPELDESRRGEILEQLFESWMAEAIEQMEVTLTIE
jgi:parvulin-like peptidyl-prolyl isomerase